MCKRVLTIFFLIVTFLFFGLLPAGAGQITLQITTTSSIAKGKVTAVVKLANSGTETARMVSLEARFQDQDMRAFVADSIAPGKTAQSGICFALPPGLRGSYPIYLSVSYKHPQGQTFSSAALGIVDINGRGKPALEIHLNPANGRIKQVVKVYLASRDPRLKRVKITCHPPKDLEVDAGTHMIALKHGKGEVRFQLSGRNGTAGNSYGVFFVAEYDLRGVHYLAHSDLVIHVKEAGPGSLHQLRTWKEAPLVLLLLIFVGAIVSLSSTRVRKWSAGVFDNEEGGLSLLLDITVLVGVVIFIISNLSPRYLLTKTITTGGDTASHYYTLYYLVHELLPAGKVTGWTPGNYAGFPLLQFYFPLPFLIMSFFNLFMPLQIAFKLVTLLGTLLLPLSAYLMLRMIRCPFPGPAIGAALTLPFLFNPANSMWGGQYPKHPGR